MFSVATWIIDWEYGMLYDYAKLFQMEQLYFPAGKNMEEAACLISQNTYTITTKSGNRLLATLHGLLKEFMPEKALRSH